MDALPFQDVIPRGERSIRRIPVPPGRRNFVQRPPLPRGNAAPPPSEPPERSARRGFRSFGLWILASLLLLALLFLTLSFVFSGAKIEVVPKQFQAHVEEIVTASRSSSAGDLAFETITHTSEASRLVPASGAQHVERRSSGVIIVYNNYSKAPQRLIKNTRFETKEGLMYRISESILVPGQKADANGGVVPGSIEVTVHADSPGEEYNIGLSDFTIPGFKGDPRFSAFYARSKTPQTGGFVGEERIVSEADLREARNGIHQELTESLKVAARAQLPERFLLYDDLIFINFVSLPTVGEGGENAKVAERGTLTAFSFSGEALAQILAQRASPGYDLPSLFFRDPEDIAVRVLDKDSIDPENASSVRLSIEGDPLFVAGIDIEMLKEELRGIPRSAVGEVSGRYPEIESIKATLTPFWKKTMPEDAGDIAIVLKAPLGGEREEHI